MPSASQELSPLLLPGKVHVTIVPLTEKEMEAWGGEIPWLTAGCPRTGTWSVWPRDPKHGWAMDELTHDLAKSAPVSTTSCDPKGPVSKNPSRILSGRRSVHRGPFWLMVLRSECLSQGASGPSLPSQHPSHKLWSWRLGASELEGTSVF